MKKGRRKRAYKGKASHELLRELFYKPQVKNVAPKLGRSRVLIYKWTQPAGGDNSGRKNPLDWVVELMELTDDRRLIQWLCEQADGYFVPNPTAQPLAGAELLPATSGVMQKLGLLQAVVAEAIQDCQVSRTEAMELRQNWEVLKSDMESYLRECEENRFSAIPAPAAIKAMMDVRN